MFILFLIMNFVDKINEIIKIIPSIITKILSNRYIYLFDIFIY
jgi:hypothetical protein